MSIKGLRITAELDEKLQPMKNAFAQAFELKPEDVVVASVKFVLVNRNDPASPEVTISMDSEGYEEPEAGGQ